MEVVLHHVILYPMNGALAEKVVAKTEQCIDCGFRAHRPVMPLMPDSGAKEDYPEAYEKIDKRIEVPIYEHIGFC